MPKALPTIQKVFFISTTQFSIPLIHFQILKTTTPYYIDINIDIDIDINIKCFIFCNLYL